MFMLHGTQKIFGLPSLTQTPAGMENAAGFIELICGALIMVGFFAGSAAFLASGTMAVAYFAAHQSNGILPRTNGGELAVAYCFAFLYIASRGSGLWSIDSVVRSSKVTP